MTEKSSKQQTNITMGKTEHISLVEKKRSPCINVISIMVCFFKWSSLICVPVDF